MYDNILQAVGRTPLVRLRHVAEGLRAAVCVKVEAQNPGGSVKDRVAMNMVAEAERRGWLRPGGTVIEATAGNTGVGLAMVAAVRGYRCVFVLPDKMSSEKILLLKAYGAEVVITPTNVPPDAPESYNGVADRLAREIPGAWRANQFGNMANPEVHYRTTGPEIWEQTDGKRHRTFVAGVGTGGTISGVGKYLKEHESGCEDHRGRPGRLDPVRRRPAAAGRSRASARTSCRKHVQRPVGRRLGAHWRRRVVPGGPADVARREGILRRRVVAARPSPPRPCATAAVSTTADLVVVIGCPDTGRNYLSKFFDDAWMAANNLQCGEDKPSDTDRRTSSRNAGRAAHVHRPARRRRPPTPSASCSKRPASRNCPCWQDGKPVGSVQEVTLARLLHDNENPAAVKVGDIMARPLPTLDAGVHLDEAYRLLLAGNPGVLATENGRPLDIVTRIDLVHYWSGKERHKG